MLRLMRTMGFNSATMYLAAFASIFLSIGVWFLQRGDDRSHAERLGIFVGLWAPTLMIMGRSMEEAERSDDGETALE